MSDVATSDRAERWVQYHRRKLKQLSERPRLNHLCPKCGVTDHLIADGDKAVCIKTGNSWPLDGIEYLSREAGKAKLR